MADFVHRVDTERIRKDWRKKQAEGAKFAKDQHCMDFPQVHGICPYCGSYNSRWMDEIQDVEIEGETHGLDFCINCKKAFLWKRISRCTDEEMFNWRKGCKPMRISLNRTDT